MVERALRVASLLLALAAMALALGLVQGGWTTGAVLALLTALALSLHGAPLAIEFITGALIDRRPGPRLSPLAALRLWWGETSAQFRVFMLDQPWRNGFAEPAPVHDPRRPAVLLIHGYLCNRAVWRRWLRPLAADTNVATLSLEPPLGSISDYAASIARAVASLRAASGAERVILVGHSMGGLAAREYLRVHGGEAVSRLVTIATPHDGTVFAPFGLGRNAREMVRGSRFLTRLAAQPCPVPVVCLATRDDNLVVPRRSTVLEGAQALWFEGIGHLALTQSPQVLAALRAQLIAPKLPERVDPAAPVALP